LVTAKGWAVNPARETTEAVKSHAVAPAIKPQPATPELLALGKKIYERQCAACHGLDGRGQGEAAYLP
jgi:cytochrome c